MENDHKKCFDGALIQYSTGKTPTNQKSNANESCSGQIERTLQKVQGTKEQIVVVLPGDQLQSDRSTFVVMSVPHLTHMRIFLSKG